MRPVLQYLIPKEYTRADFSDAFAKVIKAASPRVRDEKLEIIINDTLKEIKKFDKVFFISVVVSGRTIAICVYQKSEKSIEKPPIK